MVVEGWTRVKMLTRIGKMQTSLPKPFDVSHHVARMLVELRMTRRWSQAELAARCAAAGHPWLTTNLISSIECSPNVSSVRSRRVSVDDLVALAAGLGVAPAELLPRLPGAEEAELELAGIQQMFDDLMAKLRTNDQGEETS